MKKIKKHDLKEIRRLLNYKKLHILQMKKDKEKKE